MPNLCINRGFSMNINCQFCQNPFKMHSDPKELYASWHLVLTTYFICKQ